MSAVVYVIDTSALIDLLEWYPQVTFLTIWEELERLAKEGSLKCPREVYRELEKKNPDLGKWLGDNGIIITDEEFVSIMPEAARIDKTYPQLKTGSRRRLPNPRSADPWVVALAVSRKAVVVSTERSAPAAIEPHKIPDVCKLEGIRCLTLPEFFQELGLKV